jgi:hypothetical protein
MINNHFDLQAPVVGQGRIYFSSHSTLYFVVAAIYNLSQPTINMTEVRNFTAFLRKMLVLFTLCAMENAFLPFEFR